MKKLLILLSLVNIVLCCVILSREEKQVVIYKLTTNHYSEKNNDSLHKSSLKEFIEKANVRFPEVVYAQCLIESGHLKSNLSKTNNNLLGMKHPKQRATASKGVKNGFAHFENWKMCILDYAIWQAKFAKNCTNQEEYLELLSRVYASDKNYRDKIISLIDEFRKAE